MRIISGNYGGRRLKSLAGANTRPTTDKVKESIFNMIGPYFDGETVLDLFAGSGQMGLEAVSRGAQYAVFVENNKKAAACVEDNIRFTKFTKETKLYNSDVLSALRAMEGKYRFDIIFMDPPYKQELEYDVLSYLKDSSLLKENGIIIVEASLDTAFDYLPDMGFTLKRLKTYKTNEHAFIIKNQ